MKTNNFVTFSILISSILVGCSDSKVELKGDLPRTQEIKVEPVIVIAPTSAEIISESKSTLDDGAASRVEQTSAALEIAKVLTTDLSMQRANFDLLTNEEISKVLMSVHESDAEEKSKLVFGIINAYEKIGRNDLVESKITENMTLDILSELKKINSKVDYSKTYTNNQLITLLKSIESSKLINQLHNEDQALQLLQSLSTFSGEQTDYAYFMQLRNLQRKLENQISLKKQMQWHHETMTKFEAVQEDFSMVQESLPEISYELSWFQRRKTGLGLNETKIEAIGKLDQALKARSNVYSGNLTIQQYCQTLENLGVKSETISRREIQNSITLFNVMNNPSCIYVDYSARNTTGEASALELKALNFKVNKFTAFIFNDTNLTIETDFFDGPMIDLSAKQSITRQIPAAQLEDEDRDALVIPMVLRIGMKQGQYQTKEYDLVAHYPIQIAKDAIANESALLQGYAGGKLTIRGAKIQRNGSYVFESKGGNGQMAAEVVAGGQASSSIIDLDMLTKEIENTKSKVAGSSTEMVTQITYQDLKNILEPTADDSQIFVKGFRSTHLYNGKELNEQGTKIQRLCDKRGFKNRDICLGSLASSFEDYLKEQIQTAEKENRMNENVKEFSGASFTLPAGKSTEASSQTGLTGAGGKVIIQ